MDLARIDWNLVPALDALLSERNVSRAARRLGVSQPAASKALARLRRLYGDELLIRRGNVYVLTSLGEHLAPMARDAVGVTRNVVDPGPDLDLSTLTRTFTVATTDYAQAVLMPSVRDALALAAPGVRVNFVQPFGIARSGGEILPLVDGLISPREVLADRPHIGRLVDEWACVIANDHPVGTKGISLEDLTEYRWVVPTVTGRQLTLQLGGLRAHGVEADVALSTDNFVSVPFLVQGTDLIGLVQKRLGQRLAGAADIQVHACPWTVPPLDFTFWYDASRESDTAHRWFRELVSACMDTLNES